MANNQEVLETVENLPEKAEDNESIMQAVDSPYYGLEAGSVGSALHKDLFEESAMIMPEGVYNRENTEPAAKNERVLRFFENKVNLIRGRKQEYIDLKLQAEKAAKKEKGAEPLNKDDRKNLLRIMDIVEKEAWQETKNEFKTTISDDLTKRIEGIIGTKKDYRLRTVMVEQGIPEETFKRNKEILLKNRKAQERYIEHYFNEGPQEAIINEIRKGRKEEIEELEMIGEKKELTEEGA